MRWSALAEHLADSRASAFTNRAPAAAPERARLPPRSPLAVAARAARWHRAYSIVDCCFACRCSFHESIAPEVAVEVERDISDAEHCGGAWNSRARERQRERDDHGDAWWRHTLAYLLVPPDDGTVVFGACWIELQTLAQLHPKVTCRRLPAASRLATQ